MGSGSPLPPIDADRVLHTFLQLVQIDSVSHEEAAITAALTREFEGLGLPVQNDGTGRDGAGNLLIRLPGNRPEVAPLMLSAHMDTVEPGRGIRPRVVDGVVRSDGRTVLAADNKASLAALLEAVRVLREGGLPHRTVELVLTWGEERGHAGAAAFDVSALAARMGVTLDDAAPPGHITVAAPGYCSIHARFTGRAAHAGVAPEGGVSSILAAARAIACLPLGRLDEETTANVGLIRGGTARNAVPEVTELEGEARSRDSAKLAALVARARSAIEEAARETGARVDLAIRQEYAAYRIAPGEPIVQEVSRAIRRAGLEPALAVSGGGSDANTFNEKGIRCVNVATGMRDMHTVHEAIRVADLAKTCEIALALMTGP
jgi:tripeptide aminopeptidase